MPQDPPPDPLHEMRLKALDGEVPTEDVARLAAGSEHETNASVECTLIRGCAAGALPSQPVADTAPTLPSGKPFGRYVLLEELGHGGMGVPSTRPSASLGASSP